MCGIVGYVGTSKVGDILLDGLKRMEYRGYDSAGVAFLRNNSIEVIKVDGRVEKLAQLVQSNDSDRLGIGHTRWATHGAVNCTNAHPHTSFDGQFTIVHNGVIDNYKELKDFLISEGIPFQSDTDTEVIANLLAYFYKDEHDMLHVFNFLRNKVEGIYAVVLINKDDPNTVYVARHRAPLLIGLGNDFNMVASDMLAMIKHTKTFVNLDDDDVAFIHQDKVEFFFRDTPIEKESFTLDIEDSSAEKGVYDHFMLKEIHEQPAVLRRVLNEYSKDGKVTIKPEIVEAFKRAKTIQIIASGTSYHAGLVGKHMLDKTTIKKVDVFLGSEFGYNIPFYGEQEDVVFLLISQSGETADLRLCLEHINNMGYPVYTMTNVFGSTLAREATDYMLLYAGPEIAVASSKAYTAQIALLALLVEAIHPDYDLQVVNEINRAAYVIENVLEQSSKIRHIVETKIVTSRNCFFIGRTLDYYIALEAALKLKEISYIQAEGFAGGELKHGTIALIEKGVPVVGIMTQRNTVLALRSNLEEVKARGAEVIRISLQDVAQPDDDIIIPDVFNFFAPLVTAPVIQLIAYYAALIKGYDIDKPRNLAKSVTVE